MFLMTSLQGGPRATNASRHVCKIKDEQAMIVRGSAGKSHASASAAGGGIGAVDADIDLIVVGVDEAVILCRGLVDIVDVSMGGIATLHHELDIPSNQRLIPRSAHSPEAEITEKR